MTSVKDKTPKQLREISRQMMDYALWSKVFEITDKLYGPNKAHHVEIETYGEYNDEGGTSYYIESVNVYGADGKPVKVDFQSGWWKEAIREYNEGLEYYREQLRKNPNDTYAKRHIRPITPEGLEEFQSANDLLEEFDDIRELYREEWYELREYSTHKSYGAEGDYYRDKPPANPTGISI